MLKIVTAYKELNIGQLRRVYEGSVKNEQDFYTAIMDFFTVPNSHYALWVDGDTYLSALRIEPYRDGYLVAGLETAPAERGKGYAKALLGSVVARLPAKTKLYSHIDKRNGPSISVHKACGFSKVLDYSVFLDGSVSTNTDTYIKETPAL